MDLLESNRSVLATAAFGERAVAQIQPIISDKQPFKTPNYSDMIGDQEALMFCNVVVSLTFL